MQDKQTLNNSPGQEMSDEVYFDLLRQEKEWKESLPKYTPEQLLEIFPEAREIIPEKIAEWEEVKNDVEKVIVQKLTAIKNSGVNEVSKHFHREVVKLTDGKELMAADSHIARLKRMVYKPKKTKGNVTQEDIEDAMKIPLDTLLDCKLRQSGKNLSGLCPFHSERTPSFYIYTDTNSFYCFGCQKSGNSINLVRYLHGYGFIEAVKFLINK